jgi:CxC6 like cysteine cluster associated with KDZ transposases
MIAQCSIDSFPLPVDRIVWVIVIDGVTLGCPCCGQHNCKIPLHSNRDHFCPEHASLSQQCAIVGCTETVVNGKRTCTDPVHQEVERVKITRGQSRFILKERLQRQRVAHPNDSVAQDVTTEDLEDVEEVEEEFLVNVSGRVVSIIQGRRSRSSSSFQARFNLNFHWKNRYWQV